MEVKLQSFIDEMKQTPDNPSEDLRFRLQRFSKDEPYWCVVACEYRGKKVFYGGHFCNRLEANLHEVLTILADSGWKVEVHKGFLLED